MNICCLLILLLSVYCHAKNDIIKKFTLAENSISFQLLDIKNGKILDENNPSQPMRPASSQKILTTLFSQSVLGENYTFKTRLSHSGSIEGTTLNGDLILIGGADPYLQYHHLFDLALELKKRNIQSISGSLIYDDLATDKINMIESEGLQDEGYNSGVSALSVNFNQTQLWKIKNELLPLEALNFIKISKSSTKFPEGMRLSNSGTGENSKDLWFSSTFKNYNSIERIPVRDSSLFTAKLFLSFLEMLSININPNPKAATTSIQSVQLAQIDSYPLKELNTLNLEYSNNLMAELILINSATVYSGKKCSIDKCAKIMQEWFIKNFELTKKQLVLVNGSGLGEGNLITSQAFNKIIAKSIYDIWAQLPISGVKGLMKKVYPNRDTYLKIWSKTGNMDYVNSIAGVMLTSKNNIVAFNLLIQDEKLREKIFSSDLSESYKYRNMAQAWAVKTQKLQKELVEYWLANY